jgi:hypothetical protein
VKIRFKINCLTKLISIHTTLHNKLLDWFSYRMNGKDSPEMFLRIVLELVFISEMQVEGERLQVGRKNEAIYHLLQDKRQTASFYNPKNKLANSVVCSAIFSTDIPLNAATLLPQKAKI